MEYIVWARKASDPEWMETMVTETTSLLRAEHDKNCLEQNGYVARILNFNGEKPDFIGTIR